MTRDPDHFDGIPPDSLYPEQLRAAERTLGANPEGPTVGFALSGGGIRSATFCLGLFRALARLELVGRIDVLSTVSGGGYFGAFLGALFTRRHDDQPGQPPVRPTVQYVEARLRDLQSPPVRWLRENGRYMSPNGSGDILLAGAVVLRNWVALLLVVSTFVLTILAGAALLGIYAEDSVRGVLPSGAQPFLGAWDAYLVFAVVLWGLVVVPVGWAFWFTQRGRLPPWIVALAAVALGLAWNPAEAGTVSALLLRVLGIEALLALAWWGGTALLLRLTSPPPAAGQPRSARPLRNRLSRMLSIGLWSSVTAVAFALIDWAGRYAHAWVVAAPGNGRSLVGIGTVASLLAVLQRVLPRLIPQDRDQRIPLTPQVLAGIAAATLVSVLLVTLSAVVHAFSCADGGPPSCGRVLLLFGTGLALTLVSAFSTPFLNLSSHHGLYGARLTRAYLGASNSNRHRGASPITDLVPGDEVPLASYRPHRNGGPLHIVNVTLNETVSGRSQIEQRDRKGLGMAVGPAGISVGTRHHALWEGDAGGALAPIGVTAGFAIFSGGTAPYRAESLDLGAWVALSGAAFTPGLGARTSLSMSLLLALANVRLGYWWNSAIKPRGRGLDSVAFGGWVERILNVVLPVQTHLLNELLGRFHGPARMRWYLSDGGHSENTGAYELLRRRLPFIVISDAGRDQKYQFEDLANLVRRARTDFDAEIAFLTKEQMDELMGAGSDIRPYFGTFSEFAGKEDGFGSAHALLAYVYYGDSRREHAPGSLILVLKPSLDGDEPLDVRNYAQSKCDFPQESTADQYFDEAQWESYRRLGEHIGSRVFQAPGRESPSPGAEDGPSPGRWRPGSFAAPPNVKPFAWPAGAPSPNTPNTKET